MLWPCDPRCQSHFLLKAMKFAELGSNWSQEMLATAYGSTKMYTEKVWENSSFMSESADVYQ